MSHLLAIGTFQLYQQKKDKKSEYVLFHLFTSTGWTCGLLAIGSFRLYNQGKAFFYYQYSLNITMTSIMQIPTVKQKKWEKRKKKEINMDRPLGDPTGSLWVHRPRGQFVETKT